jgi:hypothetical protein
MLSRAIAGRSLLRQRHALVNYNRRSFADASLSRPVRRAVTLDERQALRRARKEQAAKMLQQGATAESSASSSSAHSSSAVHLSSKHSRWVWYIGVSVPTAILVWGFNDENSPPAKLSRMIGLTALIRTFSDDFARPSHDKLLPDWSQVRPNK